MAAVYCDIGLFALRHRHVDAARSVLLWIVNGEADVIYAAITITRTFSTQEDGIATDDCINWRVTVAKSIGRLVLSNRVDCDRVIIWVIQTDDMHLSHLVIGWPERRDIGAGVTGIGRCVPVVDRNRYYVAGSPAIRVADR